MLSKKLNSFVFSVAGVCCAGLAGAVLPPSAAAAATPTAASRWDWRAYPNATMAEGRTGFDVAQQWLLLAPADGVGFGRLKAEIPGLAKGARVETVRGLVHGRIIVQVSGLPPAALHTLADTLVSQGLVADAWPGLQRSTGIGFTDDHLDFRSPRSLEDLQADLVKAGVTGVTHSRLPGVYAGRALDGDAIRAAWALTETDGVDWAEPDLLRDVKVLDIPDDPQLGEQWHLENPDGRGDINVMGAWAITTGTPDIRVAIFDTGVDLDHPDLVDNFNGGFDAADGDNIPEAGCSSSPDGLGPSQSCNQQQPYRESHGTAVSGLVAARGGNGINGAGVCPDCSLYPVRIIADQGGFRSLTSAEAFQRAGEDNISAINNSWGPNLTRFFPLSSAERQSLDFVTRDARGGLGIPVLFAAGNDFLTPATANPYASYEGVITVSASTQKDDFACYSDYGDVISIAAPSQGCFEGEGGIATTDYVGADGYSQGDFTNGFGGTSAACPIATGTAALILSANPGLTAQQVKEILQISAAKILADKDPWVQQVGLDLATEFAYDDHGFSRGFGYGRIDAAAAVQLAQDMPPLAGAACGDGCSRCFEERCAPDCQTDADCPGASRCLAMPDGGTGCALPHRAKTAPGEPCSHDCTQCVTTVDSQFESTSICTTGCPNGDADCPFGFDCRALANGADPVCVPGNQECGEPWANVRCQSQVQVSGGGQDYCSCECIPGDPGACPTGFICSDVQCQQTQNAIVCAASSPQQANYLPMCIPDPNFRRPCSSHAECGGAMFCVDGTCAPDHGEGGCDLCTTCTGDVDCGEGETCVNVPARGPHCLRHCANADACPDHTICTNLPGPGGDFCVNENFNTKGICPSSWRCEQQDRCFLPSDCPEGVDCVDNTCANAMPDAAVPDAALPDAASPDATPAVDAGVVVDAATADQDAALTGADSGETGQEQTKKSGGCQMAPRGANPALLLLPMVALARRRRR